MRGQTVALERFGDRLPRPVEAPASHKREGQFDKPVRSFNLRAIWLIMARNRLLTTTMLLVVVAGLASLWLTKPVYSAQATIQIHPPASRVSGVEKIFPGARRTENERLIQAQIDLLASRSTAQNVADKLDLADNSPFLREVGLEYEPAGPTRNAKVAVALQDRLSLSSAEGSRIVNVRFDSRNPAFAARTANAYADTFTSDSLRRRLINHDLARRFFHGQLEVADARLAQSWRELVNYARNEELVVADPEPDLAGRARLSDLIAAHARAQASRTQALQRWLDVISAPATSIPVSIVQRALVPVAPAYPSMATNMALAALVGALALGADIARVRMNEKVRLSRAVEPASNAQLPAVPLPFGARSAPGPIDDKVHGPADVQNDVDAQLLGVVPLSRDGEDPALALSGPLSPGTAAHRAIFLALDRIVRAADHKVLLLTSSGPNEGKSTIALNLSSNFAASGRKVLLIETDLGRGSPPHMIGVSNQLGLVDLLVEGSTFSLVNVAQYRADRGFSVVSSCGMATNPAGLLAGRRFADLLDEAATLYDVVIIDGPPVLGLADAPQLSGMADATLFVLEANRTSRQHARLAMRRLSEAGAGKIGLVISQYDPARDVGASGHACSDDNAADERGAFIAQRPPFASRAPVHLTIDNMDRHGSELVTQHQESTQHGR
jgi:capsular exopolysaccharide synthesis family protein